MMSSSHPVSLRFSSFKRMACLLVACTFAACAAPTEDNPDAGIDPLESINRVIHGFNEVVDTILLEPVARVYTSIVPEFGRERVHNALTNLKMPVVFANSALQGDPGNTFSSLWSFLLNSTLGIGGLFDFAGANTSLVVRKEDFGQTLGSWGVGPGPYIVLPIIGSSSLRDTFGLAADIFSDPFNYADDDVVITRTILTAIDVRAGTLEITDEVYRTSLDPYATFRSLYLQKREAEVNNTDTKGRKSKKSYRR